MFFAFHRVYDACGGAFRLCVVETDDAGFAVSLHPLRGEEAGVSWLGGAAVLLPEEVVPMKGESIEDVLRRGQRAEQGRRVWRACGVPADVRLDAAVSTWRLVGGTRNKLLL